MCIFFELVLLTLLPYVLSCCVVVRCININVALCLCDVFVGVVRVVVFVVMFDVCFL